MSVPMFCSWVGGFFPLLYGLGCAPSKNPASQLMEFKVVSSGIVGSDGEEMLQHLLYRRSTLPVGINVRARNVA